MSGNSSERSMKGSCISDVFRHLRHFTWRTDQLENVDWKVADPGFSDRHTGDQQWMEPFYQFFQQNQKRVKIIKALPDWLVDLGRDERWSWRWGAASVCPGCAQCLDTGRPTQTAPCPATHCKHNQVLHWMSTSFKSSFILVRKWKRHRFQMGSCRIQLNVNI